MNSRGWEKYFSERDAKHDELHGRKDEWIGFGEKPVLLLVDIYYNVLGLKRQDIFESMKTWPGSTGLEGWAAVDKTAELLAVARENNVPVIHVKGHYAGLTHWNIRSRKPSVLQMDKEQSLKGWEFVDEVKPIPGETVILKAAPSAFQTTPLTHHLVGLGIDTVIVCGETTSGCIRATVVDGATARFKMGVVEEAVFDRSESSHWINLYDMHQKYADVVQLEYVKDYFRKIGKQT